MAREAGFEVHEQKQQARVGIDALIGVDSTAKLERFYALAVAAERDECAKVCESRYMGDNNREDMEARQCAAAIRARGEAEPLTRYRVWPDGTVQEGSESPHAWMSDDFEYVDAVNEEQAALIAGAHGIDAAMRKGQR
jgi:hypothetical protein